MSPVVANGKLPEMTDIAAVILRNAGDSVVQLESGRYTLDPKETLSFNVTEDCAGMGITDVSVTFTGGTTNLLQIIVLKEAPC